MKINEVITEDSSVTYAVYVNGKLAPFNYDTKEEADHEINAVRKKYPSAKFKIVRREASKPVEKEVDEDASVTPGGIGSGTKMFLEGEDEPQIREYEDSYGRKRWEVLDWRGHRVIQFDSKGRAHEYLNKNRYKLEHPDGPLKEASVSKWKTLRPGMLSGSYSDKQLRQMGFKQNPDTKQWYILTQSWDKLVNSGQLKESLGEAKEEQDVKKDAQDPDDMAVPLPPAHHAQKTQIAGTLPTYKKAQEMLISLAPHGNTLDFGAGLGVGANYMGSDTFEPFPRTGFNPTYTDSSQIQSNSYNRITNLNVLNVVPQHVRDNIVREIARILAPGGVAIITTRGRDVLSAKGQKGPEPTSIITSIGTYQKGFTQVELKAYIQGLLGKNFEVNSVRLGPAGVAIRKIPPKLKGNK